MRVTAREYLGFDEQFRKEAAPPMPAGGISRPAPSGAGPAAPMETQQLGEEPRGEFAPEPTGEAGANGGEGNDLSQITQVLLREHFDDEKINDASTKIQKLIPLVGPEHAEKFVKVYSDWVKAALSLKANLMALAVLATPQMMMQDRVKQMMEQLKGQPMGGGMAGGGGPPSPLKVGPIT